MACAALADQRGAGVGVRRLATQVAGADVLLRVFFPSNDRSAATSFGPWRLPLVRNADLSAGIYPLVMISHGLGGNDWSHHLLAQSLVKAGFIVVALRHPDDLLRVGTPAQSVLRPLELTAGLDAVLSSPIFGASIDRQRIGAFGFSLGGYTVQVAAGGRINSSLSAEHCSNNAQADPEFCVGEPGGVPMPIWLKLKRAVYRVSPVNLDQDLYDRRFKALVLAAPVGLPFDDLSAVTVPVMLLRAGADMALRFPYHAQRLHLLLLKPHRYEVIEGLHHYAFLSPFPDRITEEVVPPAQDPLGFDRKAFLDLINAEIVMFFRDRFAAGSGD